MRNRHRCLCTKGAVQTPERVAKVVEAIADYLATHPQAKDTRTGIREWWLPRQYSTVTDEELDAAIEQLVQARILDVDARGIASAYGSNAAVDPNEQRHADDALKDR